MQETGIAYRVSATRSRGPCYARELDTEIDPGGVPFEAVKYDLELGG